MEIGDVCVFVCNVYVQYGTGADKKSYNVGRIKCQLFYNFVTIGNGH